MDICVTICWIFTSLTLTASDLRLAAARPCRRSTGLLGQVGVQAALDPLAVGGLPAAGEVGDHALEIVARHLFGLSLGAVHQDVPDLLIEISLESQVRRRDVVIAAQNSRGSRALYRMFIRRARRVARPSIAPSFRQRERLDRARPGLRIELQRWSPARRTYLAGAVRAS